MRERGASTKTLSAEDRKINVHKKNRILGRDSRDYGDVSPLRGVVLGSAAHELYVGVSVVPVETPGPSLA